MPRRKKHSHQIPANHRRKCVDTGTVKQVVCRYIEVPAEYTSPKKEGFTFEDIPGVKIHNYSSYEAAEEAHGEGSFTNNYTEDDFLRP
jgi:hypothetical protein|tara:strand:- start:296 stop:559 length:264 start_codon:yes stop_codon:yes gene_type:complete